MKETDGKSGTLIPKVISVVAVIAMVAAFFLPFVSATGDYREWLLENPDAVQSEEISMTNADMADLSLLAYAVSYSHGEGIGMDGFESTFYMVLCVLPLVLSVLALVLSLASKPVGTMVFSILTVAVVSALVWDFGSRRIVYDGGRMAFACAQYVYYAGAALSVVGSAWLISARRKARKASES